MVIIKSAELDHEKRVRAAQTQMEETARCDAMRDEVS